MAGRRLLRSDRPAAVTTGEVLDGTLTGADGSPSAALSVASLVGTSSSTLSKAA
jgi:hypothetical protein